MNREQRERERGLKQQAADAHRVNSTVNVTGHCINISGPSAAREREKKKSLEQTRFGGCWVAGQPAVAPWLQANETCGSRNDRPTPRASGGSRNADEGERNVKT